MRRTASALLIALAIAAPAFADNPTLFAPGPGGPPIEGGRDVCWSEPGDPLQNIGSSEVMGEFGIESEIANDFLLDEDTIVVLARWWGGYWNGPDENFNMNLRFYADGGCVPTDMLAEWLNVDANQTEVEGGVYVYSHLLAFPAVGGTRYWFVAQAADHLFPPQWGRLGTSQVTQCDSMFRSEYFSYPDWYVDHWGGWYEASQEFECEAGTAAARTTWGAMKGLYR